MKNTTVIITNYILSKFVSPKTSASNATEILQECFTSKTKQVAFLVNAILFIFLSLSVMGSQAKAASFSVNLNTDASDVNPGNGVCDADLAAGTQCTLRAAIQESNALAGIDDISFAIGTPNTISLTLGALNVVGSVSINGPGARGLTVQRAAGAANFRIFDVIANANTSISIYGMTIANGNTTGDTYGAGAGIRNQSGSSSLNLTGVTVKNNFSQGAAGGIQNNGTLNITRSTVSNNTGGQGGGVNNGTNGIMNISNTTISNNEAVLSNAPGWGGGIMNINVLTLNNVTVSNNNASNSGGGIHLFGNSQTLNIRNTIVAGNTSTNTDDKDFNSDGVVNSLGNNLIGISGGTNGFTNGVNGDKVGTLITPLDAKLGNLQDNGGQTDTRALLAGSSAIDGGNNCVVAAVCSIGTSPALTTDQRGAGFQRIVDSDGNGTATVDIGANEAQLAPTAGEVVASGRVFTANGKGIQNVKITVILPSGETRTTVSGAGGFYQFADLPAGETYIFSVSAKHYTFAQNTQIRSVTEDVADVDFIADNSAKKLIYP
jgi:hypothetical protein